MILLKFKKSLLETFEMKIIYKKEYFDLILTRIK